MILDGRDFFNLGSPMWSSYLDNIERIGGHDRAAPYRARLEDLEDQVNTLNTVCQADVEAITEIESARLWAELVARQEELRRQEEVWSRELAELRASQESILRGLEIVDFEIEGSQTTILRARETIARARAILQTSESRLGESVKKRKELILQQGQLKQEGIIRSHTIEEFCQRLAQQLAINDDDLRRQAQHSVEETRRRVIDDTINKLKLLGDP